MTTQTNGANVTMSSCRETNTKQQFSWSGNALVASNPGMGATSHLTARVYTSGNRNTSAITGPTYSAAQFRPELLQEIASLAARVTSTDHFAGSAVITGTARPGARVEVGDEWVTAHATTGAFSLTVTDLAAGVNSLTVIQKIDNVQVGNSVPLTVTIVEGGTVVPVPQPGVELVRGETSSVPFVVQLNEARSSVSGTTTVKAPAGTTFSAGQTTVAGAWRPSTTGEWSPAANINLTGGVLSADRTEMTFDIGPSGSNHAAGQQWRYEFNIDTPMVAAGGASSLGYVYEGSSTGNPFRAVGSTPTTIEVNEQPTVASVVSVDPIAKTAVVSGTATPGATITIGDQEAVVQDDGNWSMTVEGLQVGSNQLVVQQSIAGEDYGDPVTLDAVVPALTTSLGANDVIVTSEADGWFTEGTEGTVTITTQTGTSPTGATVRPGESLSWTTTLPEGFEAGDLPATETVDGWTTEHVVATDSEGRQTVEVKVTNATTENREYAAAGDITFPVVSTGKPTSDGTITTVFTPPTSYTSSAPDASTVAKAPLPLTATVAQRNDIAQTVVVTGSGTPGQQVTIGDVTETIRPDGSYEITAPFTGTGDLEVTVSQEIGGTVHDEATVEFTSVEGGTLVGVQQTRVNLPRNTTSIIPIVVQNNEARDDATGTVTFTAPKDTIFQDGLTVLGERRSGTAGGWESDASLDLTGGVISENGTKITFQLPARAIPAEQQLRYLVEVFTSRTASAGNRQLDYTYEGTSSIGDFRATGSTIGRVASIDPSAIRE
ncbi:hypothetical protein IFT72_14100 [Frigoribacterium sp. CFBP 8754]|uniref:hypothetical protein n=1 Tax=Frigoribacterium sp. CFBP 8754 TaxID=2775290 RepID=UPI00177A7CF0|nr:hypothetical protein [Frigoribacterium sp. CFBP 8754]MBD8661318.1 hypothetical protein [Frigoribacterium sp. CFBP 8754]